MVPLQQSFRHWCNCSHGSLNTQQLAKRLFHRCFICSITPFYPLEIFYQSLIKQHSQQSSHSLCRPKCTMYAQGTVSSLEVSMLVSPTAQSVLAIAISQAHQNLLGHSHTCHSAQGLPGSLVMLTWPNCCSATLEVNCLMTYAMYMALPLGVTPTLCKGFLVETKGESP